MYSVDCCPKGLVIGKQGENEAEKVVIDFSAWASEHGAGTISARLRRPKNSAAYPVILTTEGTTATWTVSATDTQYAGAGSLQLVYIVGDVVAKSVIWPVRVLPSLEEGEAPEPYESWLDTLEGLAADTQENARDAAASAADAAQSAQDAAESAASITGLTAVAETLPEGSEASASFDSTTDTLTLGIPRGDTGATGPAGPAGPKGDTGADGFSPSASVTKTDGNITITITDKDGTTSETLEVDDALDDTSVNPVQNAAIVEAMRSMLPVDTASGAIASFPDGADDVPTLSLKAQIEPVQDLHGYDSPWPAGGWVNKLDLEAYVASRTEDYSVDSEGWVTINDLGQAGLYANRWSVGPFTNGSILMEIDSARTTATNARIRIYNNGSGVAESATKIENRAFDQIGFNWNESGKLTCRISVVDAATISSWTPYSNICPISGHTGVNISHSGADMTNPDVIPVSWESEAGTVYGGELDVVSGKLTNRMAMVDLGTLNYGYNATYKAFSAYKGNIKAHGMCVSSQYKYGDGVGAPDMTCCLGYAGWFVNNIVIKDSRYTNASDFKSAVSGVQLCYELAQPIEYTLTPQEVHTLLGQNNIWNDTGNTEVTYRADIQKYIEKKVNA